MVCGELRGFQDEAAARELFETRLAADQLAKIRQIKTPSILVKIANAIAIWMILMTSVSFVWWSSLNVFGPAQRKVRNRYKGRQ